MFKDKLTNYFNTISTSDQEEALIARGEITGYNVQAPSGTIPLPISAFSEPFRIPLTDKDTGEFKGWSAFWLRKFKMSSGNYNGLKIYSQEEIKAFQASRE
jgi:hypothetical protein